MTARRSCPLCGSGASSPVVSSSDGEVVACVACEMLFLDTACQETEWPESPDYLDMYVTNRERYAAIERGAARAALDATGIENGAILEVGLGVAALAAEAQERRLEYWCVEPHGPMVDAAVERGLVAPHRAFRAPIDAAELPHDRFDAVVALMVLEHLIDPLAALRCCVDALKPGGVLYIEVPNSRLFAHRTRLRRAIGMSDFMHGHINFFTPRCLSRAFASAPLREIEPRVISNARRGDAALTTEYYADSRRALRVIYWALALVPVDEWLGVASVLSCRGVKPVHSDEGGSA